MTGTLNVYEETFAKTEKTDAVLVVGDKKLHVNKALLSYHSDYFNTLFNTDFKEKSTEEIPIDDVIFEDFATLLSLVQEKPIKFTDSEVEKLLELSDRFRLPSAKRHVELFICSTKLGGDEKLRLADKYELHHLLKHTVPLFNTTRHFQLYDQHYSRRHNPTNCDNFREKPGFASLTDDTKEKMLDQVLDVVFGKVADVKIDDVIVAENSYEEAFVKTDKTDGILVVQGKKMHVNKALLSYHSDYFNTLFNSNFKEKSMKEIPIDDVIFEDFAAFLSLVQDNPIVPTESNAEKLLEHADRFLMPSVKRHVELFLMTSSKDRIETIRIADKYQLEDLVMKGISMFKEKNDFKGIQELQQRQKLTPKTKAKIFHKLLTFEIVNVKLSINYY